MTHLLMNRDRGYAGNVATDANMVMWIRETGDNRLFQKQISAVGSNPTMTTNL
jgi:hypothetical protein